MAWTLKHTPASGSPVTKSFAEWGFNELGFDLRSLEPGACSWHQPGAVFGDTLLFSFGDGIEVFEGGTRRFAGSIQQEPTSYFQGNQRGLRWQAHDALAIMAVTPYAQAWQASIVDGGALGSQYLAALAMFRDGAGNAMSISAQASAIVSHAAFCGIPISWGGYSGGDATPFEQQEGTLTLLEALRACLRLVPDVCHRMDYTTTPPTLSLVRYSAATAVNLTLPANAISGELRPRGDQVAAGVVLQYKQTHTLNEESRTLVVTDAYPPGASINTPRTIAATFEFQGSQRVTQEQYVAVRTIQANSQTFWRKHIPWIKDMAAGFTISGGEVAAVDETDTRSYTKYIYDGQCPDWLSDYAAPVTVKATLNGVYKFKAVVNHELVVQVTGTRLSSGGVFSNVVSDSPAEDLPTGLAAAVYAAASVKHHEGVLTFRHNQPWSAAPRVGDLVNIPAKAAWSAINAQVQGVSVQVDTGTVTLQLGPPKHLGVQDVVEWFRRARQTRPGFNAASRASGAARGTARVLGARLGPDSNSVPGPNTSAEQPWALRPDGSVVPGTVQPASGMASIPTIGDTPISGGSTIPKLTIPQSGYLVMELTFNPMTFNDGWLSDPLVLESVKLACASQVPANQVNQGKFYRVVCSITQGVPGLPFFNRAGLAWSMCGNSEGTADLTLQ